MELKVRYPDLERAARIVESLGGEYVDTLLQIDTYFRCDSGRLKLREITFHNSRETQAQLIWYQRPDQPEIRGSDYLVSPVPEPGSLKEALRRSVGMIVEVRKSRELYLWEHIRVHLDHVDGAGRFIEVEAVLHPGETDSDGRRRLEPLCHHLQVRPADFVPQSYAELVAAVA
jgi:predicted adenylyl cyclase CyaB